MVAVPSARLSHARASWWLWPHLLSLDAPLVALVWQRWWARAAGVTLPLSREVVLGLGVWLIYLVDRLADATGSDHFEHRAARHVFSARHRKILRLLTRLIALTLVIFTPRWLTGAEFRSGLCLLSLALGYYWLIHCWPGRSWAAYLPKEAAVGGMFGAGSIFFVACRASHLSASVWLVVALFATVCFLNCAFITKWERDSQDLRERSSLLNSFPGLITRLGVACVVVAVVASVVCVAAATTLAVPVAVSALLLAILDRRESRPSTDALRVAADVVLLTPWIGLFCLSPTS